MAFYSINEHGDDKNLKKVQRLIKKGILVEVKGLKEDAHDRALKDDTIEEVKKVTKKTKKDNG